jgi:hypothetical protein
VLDFTQATNELNHADRIIAKAIREQQTGGDPFANHLIETYSAGTAGSEDNQTAFLTAYDAWRNANVALVVPIAQQLGHPVSGSIEVAPAAPTAPPPSPAVFAQPPVPVAPMPVAAAPQPIPAPQSPPAAPMAPTPAPSAPAAPGAPSASAAGTPAARKRTSWSQTDIVALTRFLLAAPVEQHEAAFPIFDQQTAGRYGVDAIKSKAVELELTPAPVAPSGPRELNADEQTAIGEAILEWIAPEAMDRETRLARLRYAGTAIREIAKGIDRSNGVA